MMSMIRLQLILIALAAASAGCSAVHVRVLDVETGEPVPWATVVSHEESFGESIMGSGPVSQTGADGRTTLRASLLRAFYGFEVYADGYLPWLAPERPNLNYDPGTPVGSEIVLYVYQAPGPVALLTVPNDYRGPLLITRPKKVQPPLSIRQRVHEFIVQDPAVPTVVPESPPLHMTWTSRIQVRYTDGRSLPNYLDFRRPAGIGTQVYVLETYSDPEVLFVGEVEEFHAFRRMVNHPSGRFWDFDSDALKRELEAAVRRWSQLK